MLVREVLSGLRLIHLSPEGSLVQETVAMEIRDSCALNVKIMKTPFSDYRSEKGHLFITSSGGDCGDFLGRRGIDPGSGSWVFFHIDDHWGCWLISSHPQFLYAGFRFVSEELMDADAAPGYSWKREISFTSEKSTFDIFLTQYARLVRDFSRGSYIRECSRLGFTHVEVNALAAPFPHEKGVAGEFYPDFYTYCPALDQFVSSRLNRGIYPEEYLQANLLRLKDNARLAVKYGLVPGLLCFEPRSVPEEFFRNYPTLRGARVDHPFRSFKPRYNLSIAHPVVQQHYAELVSNLLNDVPELGFMTIWTNDSGAGFEHTRSLYVGRNGGAYMIREWKGDEDIARTASHHILNFFRLLRDAAGKINPEFQIVTRLEPFYGERPYLWKGLENGVHVECHSLLTSGWEANYTHPVYNHITVLGSALHHQLREEERIPAAQLESRGSGAYFYHLFGPHGNHEPLLGIPFPWLTREKLESARSIGVKTLAHLGGIQPPEHVPYAVNQEVFRRFQFYPDEGIDAAVQAIARKYTSPENSPDLILAWKLIDSAVRHSVPLSIYTHYGVVWQRLLVRPLVPDIDRIPESKRAYYEKFMCTSVHNPNRIDLARDVLFDLISKEYAHAAFGLIDKNVKPRLEQARELLEGKKGGAEERLRVFEDLSVRCSALLCLMETLRNTAAWVYAVHEFLEAENPSTRNECRFLLDDLIEREITNCGAMKRLYEGASIDWMILSGSVETPFIYGQNFGDLLEKKMDLMRFHKNDDPRVDPEYMFRVVGNPYL